MQTKGDRNFGKKATGSPPQCVRPNHHPQPHRILHQLLQGDQLCQTFIRIHFVEIYITCPKMFQDAYFESVIAINLTSMLVLVALFVQVKIHNSSVSGKNTNAL